METEAENCNFFDRKHLFTEKRLDRPFRKKHKQYFRNYKRGYGYWLWKPYLICKILQEEMVEGDTLVYLDAGCEIHPSGEQRWREYLALLEHCDCILFENENLHVRQMTKMDLLEHFEAERNEDILNRRQISGGCIILKKSDFTLRLFQKWLNCCETYKETLLCDAPSAHAERPDFIENRHDQAILTLICLKEEPELTTGSESRHIRVLEQREVYSRLPDWNDMTQYPFWTKRNKEFAQPGWLDRAARKIRRFLNIS